MSYIKIKRPQNEETQQLISLLKQKNIEKENEYEELLQLQNPFLNQLNQLQFQIVLFPLEIMHFINVTKLLH